ncbi:MAG: hypothetical protein QOH49_3912 [Acidobacteriota bacterium]|jgi:hypothetical protein|nr:hypothetical protein [Acidobacteriota bacterium]
MKKSSYILLVGAALLLLPASARAQFRGDVFFASPSVSVPAGGVAVLEVQMFSGADVVGATHIDIVFDPARAEVVAVEPGTTPELADGLASANSPGRAGIVTLNGKSFLQPLGTVSLAKVRVKPLVAAGNKVALSIQVHSLLRQDNTPFPSFKGFSGEILVVSASTSSALTSGSGALLSIQTGEDTAERARAFRRPGLAVDVLNFELRGGGVSAKSRQVIVPDSEAPADTKP